MEPSAAATCCAGARDRYLSLQLYPLILHILNYLLDHILGMLRAVD